MMVDRHGHEPAMPLLDVADVTAGYGEVVALHDVSLAVDPGQTVAVLGVNGAGKSTLLQTIAGLNPVRRGTVRYEDEDVTKLAPHELFGRGLALVPEGRELFPTLSVEENLRVGAIPFGSVRGDWVDERVEDATALFPVLRDRSSQLAGTLSGGEQQMLAIARALIGKPRLLLLDEPSLGLSPIIVDGIYTRLRQMTESGLSMLIVEQHVDRALSFADHAYVLDLGRVVTHGDPAELKSSGALQSVYFG